MFTCYLLQRALFEYPFDMGQVLPAVQVLATAAHVSGIMMVMAFRGWILWIVNVSLAIFMFTQTFKIYDYNQMRRKVSKGHARLALIKHQSRPT